MELCKMSILYLFNKLNKWSFFKSFFKERNEKNLKSWFLEIRGSKLFLLHIVCTMYKTIWLWRTCILCWFKLINIWCFLKSLVFKKQIIFFKHDFTKRAILIYSWHQFYAQCIKRSDHAKCAYFVYSNC